MRIVSIIMVVFSVLCAFPLSAQTVDLNTASAKELERLPGIGGKLAEEIIREREENGAFASVEDLTRVPGISSGVVVKLADKVRVGRTQAPLVIEEGQVVSAEIVRKVLARYAAEPTIKEVQTAVLDYTKVHPEVVSSWQLRARTNALLPQLRTQFGYDTDQNLRTRTNLDATEAKVVTEDDDHTYQVDVRAQWDLDRLVFEPQELAVARESVRIANLRDRVLDEVTRRYFERRRLQVDLELSPPTDLADRIRKELRVQELTADIDSLTGGWFSRRLENAGRNPY